jgi:hypothetical protein
MLLLLVLIGVVLGIVLAAISSFRRDVRSYWG